MALHPQPVSRACHLGDEYNVRALAIARIVTVMDSDMRLTISVVSNHSVTQGLCRAWFKVEGWGSLTVVVIVQSELHDL